MSHHTSARPRLELITKTMNELAREVGIMELDDPNWVTILEELSELTQLRRAVKLATEPVIVQYMDELARGMVTLKPGRSSAGGDCGPDNAVADCGAEKLA